MLARRPELSALFAGNRRDAAQRERRAGILARPVEVDLRAVTAATLLLVGSEDRLIPPAHSLSLARDIRHAATAVLAGLGHVGTIQDPAAVASAVLAFLRDTKT